MAKVSTCLTFAGEAGDVANFYKGVFNVEPAGPHPRGRSTSRVELDRHRAVVRPQHIGMDRRPAQPVL